jgi:hypothetical protein
MEISVARKVAKEVTEKRELRRQESLQAMQNVGLESGEENSDEGNAGQQNNVDHYQAEDGAIYTRVKKTSKTEPPPPMGISPKKIKKNSSGGNLSDLSDFSSPISQQLSPHGRTSRTKSPLADVNHYPRRMDDDDGNSLYSDWTSVSHRVDSHLHPESRTNLSEYSEHMSQAPPMGRPQMGPGYRGYPPMYPPNMYQPHPHQPRSVEERMRMEAMHGKYPVPPQPYPYPYHPQMVARGRGRGYPYMPYPYMYPGYYPPYGAPGPHGPYARGPPGPGVPRSRSAGSGGVGKPGKKSKEGKSKLGKKNKSGISDTRSESRFTGGNMEIGYGPSTIDGDPNSRPTSGKRGRQPSDVPDDFHPPPPPTTKGGNMKEFVEHGNFIMVKRTPDSHAPKVHPSGVRLHPAKNMKEYDGRYDDFIEEDPFDEEIDEHFNIGVLIEAATVAIIGSVVGIKDLRASMVSMKRKNRSKKPSVQMDKVADVGGRLSANTPKKIKSYQDLWGGGGLERDLENMSEHEKYALMLSDHTPTTWGNEEEEEKKPAEVKKRVRSPQKKKQEADDSPYMSDMVKTLSKQYSASRTSLNTLGTNTGSLGGDLGMSLQARQSSLLNLAATDLVTDPYQANEKDDGGFEEVESRIQGKTDEEIRREKARRKAEKRLSAEEPAVSSTRKEEEPAKTKSKKKTQKKSKSEEKKSKHEAASSRPESKEEPTQSVEQMEIDFRAKGDIDMEPPPPADSDDNAPNKMDMPFEQEVARGKEVVMEQEVAQLQEVEVSSRKLPSASNNVKVEQLHAVDVTVEPEMSPPIQPSPPNGPKLEEVTPEPQVDVAMVAEVVVPVETAVKEKKQNFDGDNSPPPPKEERRHKPSAEKPSSSRRSTSKSEEKASKKKSTTKEEERSSAKKTSKSGERSSRSSKGTEPGASSKRPKSRTDKEDKHKRTSKVSSSTDEVNKTKEEETPAKLSFDSSAFQFPNLGFGIGLEPSQPVQPPTNQPPAVDNTFGDIFADLTTSDSMADLLKGIEDEIKEMESMTKKPKDDPPRASASARRPATQTGRVEAPVVNQDLAQELMKLGELGGFTEQQSSPVQVQPQVHPVQPQPSVPPTTTTVDPSSHGSAIIEKHLVSNLLEVNKMLSSTTLSAQELFQYQVQHNQLVADIVRQALVAKEKGMDTAALAQAIALALSQLDNYTVSQVLSGINQARSLSDIKQSGLDASDSSLSLTSEIETAIRKFQEEQLKEQKKHFKSQAEFQEFMKRQVEEQSKVYLQMQEQSKLYIEMQIQQTQALANAQKKMNEQEMRLKQTEENLKAQMSSRDKAAELEKERKMQELEMKVKMYEEMKTQQEDYHKQFQDYYEKKMEEMMKKMSTGSTAEVPKKEKRKKKKKPSVPIDNVSSSDDELVPATPSLKQQILQHAEAKEHQARIHYNNMLTEESLREFTESRIPHPPPVPSQSYLLGRFKRTDTRSRISEVYKSFSRFEKGDEDSESSDNDEFVQPVQIGGTKRASLKHAEPGTVMAQVKGSGVPQAAVKQTKEMDNGAQAFTRKIGAPGKTGAPEDSPFEQFDYIQKRAPKQFDPPKAQANQPIKNKFLNNPGGGIDKINAFKSAPGSSDHTYEGANPELKAIFEKRQKSVNKSVIE